MKGSIAALALAALAPAVSGQFERVPSQETSELYDSGVIHQQIMDNKIAQFTRNRERGDYDSTQYPTFDRQAGPVKCVRGRARVVANDPKNTFKCRNIDFYDFVSHADLGSKLGEGSSSWGWTHQKTGREFVAIGQYDGTAFAEITKAGKLVYLGRLPQFDPVGSYWREIRSFRHYMLIGSEAVGHGVQIFNMRKLLDIDPAKPKLFSNKNDLTSHWDDTPLGRTHNVHANTELGLGFAVGAQPRDVGCLSGIQFIDLKDPAKPKSLGCAKDDGYVHDLECVVYRGPHKKYVGKPICYGYNEDTLTIYDITNKNTTKIISRTSYVGASYTHQGSVLDRNNQEFLLLDDELDEEGAVAPADSGYPVTYIWDIRNLEKPKQTGFYRNNYARTIDHNQYVVNGLSYQSNYGAGLHVLNVSSIPSDPTGKGVSSAGFFDIFPEDDGAPGGGNVEFTGTWSHYPYFKSGYIFINTIERGAFVVKMQ